MTPTLRRLSAGVAVVACAGLWQASAAPKPATRKVTIDATSFEPRALSVRLGDSIEWVNADVLAHTATAKDGPFDSKTILPGKSWRTTPSNRGTFPYRCVFHPTMTGTITVR